MFRKGERRHIALLVVLVLSAAFTSLVATVHFTQLDGISGWMWSHLLGDKTQYASGYSEGRFRRIRVGMDTQQVVGLLGQPLDVQGVATEGQLWRYTVSNPKGHYFVRALRVRDNHVEEVVHEFYVD